MCSQVSDNTDDGIINLQLHIIVQRATAIIEANRLCSLVSDNTDDGIINLQLHIIVQHATGIIEANRLCVHKCLTSLCQAQQMHVYVILPTNQTVNIFWMHIHNMFITVCPLRTLSLTISNTTLPLSSFRSQLEHFYTSHSISTPSMFDVILQQCATQIFHYLLITYY